MYNIGHPQYNTNVVGKLQLDTLADGSLNKGPREGYIAITDG